MLCEGSPDMLRSMGQKKVKIVATIGPASNSYKILLELAKAGVDVYRINLAHQPRESIVELIKTIRRVEKEIKRPIAIMGDLAGPKIRLGRVAPNIILRNNQQILITKKTVIGNTEAISINYPTIISQLKKNAEIYIDDGKIRMIVEKEGEDKVLARVIVGGTLVSYKGFYAQGLTLANHGLTKKDKEDIQLMVNAGVDALAISFVQTEKDVDAVKRLLPKDSAIMLIAKIETSKAIEQIEKILTISDGIMVARGDLGLAVHMSKVPHLQKRLINLALQRAKPVITATQMLESMTTNPLPTRAEVTDVANAILDGTDAVMLSSETAMGKFPVETVKMMSQIIHDALPYIPRRQFDDEHTLGGALSSNIGRISDQLNARLVVAFTHTGRAAHRIARHRYPQTIIALCPVQSRIRWMCFSWGVSPFLISPTQGFSDMRSQARNIATQNPILKLKKGEPFLIVAGMPFGQSGTTNMIFIDRI